jgi:hypothetical protein
VTGGTSWLPLNVTLPAPLVPMSAQPASAKTSAATAAASIPRVIPDIVLMIGPPLV